MGRSRPHMKVPHSLASSQARDVLNLPADGPLTVRQIRRQFKLLAKTAHPDKGGSELAFVTLYEAHDTLIGEFEDALKVR